MKSGKQTLFFCAAAVIVLLIFGVFIFPQQTLTEDNLAETELPDHPQNHITEVLPFDINMAKAETDKYFGTPAAYDPLDQSMNRMREIFLAFAEAMDNPKYPCNPLVTTNSRIVGMNIKPLSHGDKRYTMWVSDGTATCGLELIHYTGWSGATFKGDFFQRFYLHDLAAGYYYPNKDMVDEIVSPDKKRFFKSDIGEVAHDMVANALGDSFFANTLPGQYSGFFVADAYNTLYLDGGKTRNVFTQNIVDANLRRTDLPFAAINDPVQNSKFSVYVEAVPNGSELAFKVVYADTYNNGFDPARMNGGSGQQTAVRLQ